jgi:hypothetical protein
MANVRLVLLPIWGPTPAAACLLCSGSAAAPVRSACDYFALTPFPVVGLECLVARQRGARLDGGRHSLHVGQCAARGLCDGCAATAAVYGGATKRKPGHGRRHVGF